MDSPVDKRAQARGKGPMPALRLGGCGACTCFKPWRVDCPEGSKIFSDFKITWLGNHRFWRIVPFANRNHVGGSFVFTFWTSS